MDVVDIIVDVVDIIVDVVDIIVDVVDIVDSTGNSGCSEYKRYCGCSG